jgi:sterol desaturase/sphingolipid hydroxylase (fatty acid hydroxylase superfamily)
VIAVLLATVSSFVLLVVAFVPLERAFPSRPAQKILRPRWAVDAYFFAGQYLLWNGVALALLAGTEAAVRSHEPLAFRAWTGSGPGWLRAVLAVVLGDVVVYWFHRACHTFEPLWRFHAVHHSAEHLDFLAAHREHPLDGIGTQLAANLPGLVMGFDFRSAAGLVAFRAIWAVFVHSNVRLPLGPLRVLFGAPELHHWHHAKVERTRHNFANLAPWIDIVFGTHHRPNGPEEYALGLQDEWPVGYLSQLVHPFRLTRARQARE